MIKGNNTKHFQIQLPGQGQYGMSYFGQIRQFNEFEFYPDLIQSTSMGSYQGQFLQFQIPFKEYMNFLEDMNNLFNDIFDYILAGIEGFSNLQTKYGFYNSENIINVVKKYIPDTWDEMKIPIKMTCFDVTHNKEHIFGYEQDTSIPPYLQVVQSGCTQPLQTPIKINDTYFADGGYLNNVPVNLIKEYKTKILISPSEERIQPVTHNNIHNFIDFIYQIIGNLSSIVNTMKEKDVKDYYKVITGVKDVHTIFDFQKYNENMDLGYNNTKKFINDNLKLFI